MRERPRLDDEANVRMAPANIVVRYNWPQGSFRLSHGSLNRREIAHVDDHSGARISKLCGECRRHICNTRRDVPQRNPASFASQTTGTGQADTAGSSRGYCDVSLEFTIHSTRDTTLY